MRSPPVRSVHSWIHRLREVAQAGSLDASVFRMKLRRYLARRWPEVILALGSVVASLLAAEVGLRIYYRVRTSRALARMAAVTAPEEIHTDSGQLAPGVRLSSLPNVVYELRPNLHGVYDGRKFRSDRFGFRRDGEVQVAKPEGTLRIVGIGDSWMWGSGVDNGETYLDRLHELLSADGLHVEVINTGVWGYNARQQVATLRWKGLLFEPDVVVIGLCGNDREYTSFLDERPFVEFGRSFLWNEISSRLRGFRAPPSSAVPERMPFSEFIAAYADLAALSKSSGFSVVVFSECFRADGTEDRSCDLGNADEWREFTNHLDDWGFHLCPWNIGEIPQNYPDYGHATPEGNRKLASILAECVRPLLLSAAHRGSP